MFEKFYYRLHKRASRVDERGEYSSGYWQDKVRSTVLSWCRLYEGKLLEVGCGEGLFLSRLAAERPELLLWGIDNHSQRCARAGMRFVQKNLGNIREVLKEEADRLSFENNLFDTVICINVFLNLASFEMLTTVLSQMYRVCRPGGRIIFDFRNSRNFLLKLKYKLAPLYDKTVSNLPLRVEDPQKIRVLLKDLGLCVRRFEYIGFGPHKSAPIVIVEAQKNEFT